MNKMEELLHNAKLNELLHRDKLENERRGHLFWVLAIIGAIATIAVIAYAVTRYFAPDYDDFDGDFDYDELDDDFDLDDDDSASHSKKD
jgi:hypothetical protein